MKTLVHGIFRFAFSGLVLAALTACGGGGYGGGGGGGGGGATYTVGGTVTGLTGSGLILRNNGGGDLAVPVSGTFMFATKVANGAAYDVTVYTQPASPAQTCVITNGSGTMGSSNVTNVAVACTNTAYSVSGSVTGFSGPQLALSDLTLQSNLGGIHAFIDGRPSFAFGGFASGAAYAVTVGTQPSIAGWTCVVANGSGTMGSSNVTNVEVNCTTDTATGACGIPQATGLTSAGPAEGAWGGRFPSLRGDVTIGGSGVVAADGQAHFWVGDNEMWVGTVLASSSGVVSSVLTLYYRLAGGGPGGPMYFASSLLAELGFDTAAAGATLSGQYAPGDFSNCQPLNLSYSDVYRRPASLAAAAGVYTASDGNGYTLTVTIHSDGQLDGSDTLGCMLIGSFAVPDPAVNYYSAVADATTCGTLDGHYVGMLSLSDLVAPNDNLTLNLSLSNSGAAIFQRLTR